MCRSRDSWCRSPQCCRVSLDILRRTAIHCQLPCKTSIGILAYLDDILVHARFATEYLEGPVRGHGTHTDLLIDRMRRAAELPALLLAEGWSIEASVQQLSQQTLRQVVLEPFIAAIQLISQDRGEIEGLPKDFVPRFEGVTIHGKPRKLIEH